MSPSSDIGFPPKVAESGLELFHGDAFKKGTMHIAPPPPALAVAESKFSPRSVRRNPTPVHGRRRRHQAKHSPPPAPPRCPKAPRLAATMPGPPATAANTNPHHPPPRRGEGGASEGRWEGEKEPRQGRPDARHHQADGNAPRSPQLRAGESRPAAANATRPLTGDAPGGGEGGG